MTPDTVILHTHDYRAQKIATQDEAALWFFVISLPWNELPAITETSQQNKSLRIN